MARWIHAAKSWMAVGAVVLILGGCGGGGHGYGDDRRGLTGALTEDDLDENRYYDVYDFRAEADGEAIVEMNSDDFDCFLIIYRQTAPNVFTEIVSNDDGGSGSDARANFQITRNTRYRVIATAHTRDTGDYEIIFSRNLGQPTLILADTAGRESAKTMVLPPPGAAKQPDK